MIAKPKKDGGAVATTLYPSTQPTARRKKFKLGGAK